MAATVPQQQVTAAQKLAQVNEQTWLTMGNLAEMMTDYDKAMNCYESALRHNPYSVVALSQIASLCRGREQFGRAVEYFKRILAIQENNGETWAALGHCYLMMDNLQEAYQAYQQALYHLPNPKDPKLWYGIGILYDRYGSLEHAEEAFSAVMKMDPKFEKANEIYFRLGIIYKQQQKFDLSLQCFRYILHNPPRPLTESDIWFQTGHVYEQQKEYELAKEAYERVLAENPDHAKVLQQLGWLYHQQNTSFCNQALAIQYLTRSLKSDSNDAQSWYLLGRCYMAEQNYNKAYEAYQQAVYRDARNPTFWCSIGVLYYQINQYRDALDAYSRAIRLNPYISEVWYDLGTLYESCNNQVQDALDAYQRAAELDPSNPHIKQRLDLLRKSQNIQSSQVTGSAPVPQDVSNPSQYQTGHNGQQLSGASYNQSAPSGPPSSMSAYHTAMGGGNSSNPPRLSEDRVPTPQLPVNHSMNVHENNNNGPARDLPIPGPPLTSSNRRSPGPYSQYPSHSSSSNNANAREDVRIPDIGGGRAPTPSERSQMNPIIHDERPSSSAIHHHQPPPQQLHNNLPPMNMRQPYKPASSEETRSPNPVHSRPSPRTSSHPLVAPPPPSSLQQQSYDHRLSPRTSQMEGYRYDQQQQQQQRSPAQRPMEVDSSAVSTSSPRSAPRTDYRMKHEDMPTNNYHTMSPVNRSNATIVNNNNSSSSNSGINNNNNNSNNLAAPTEQQHYKPQHEPTGSPLIEKKQSHDDIMTSKSSAPTTTTTSSSNSSSRQVNVDENYDESAADALLSMGNPHLGQKRALQYEQDENKKARPANEEHHDNKAVVDKMDIDTHATAAEEHATSPKESEKEEGENDEEITKENLTAEEQPKEEKKKEIEEGEVEEHEEGEVKDDDDNNKEEESSKSIVPTAAVAATNAATAAASQTTITKQESS